MLLPFPTRREALTLVTLFTAAYLLADTVNAGLGHVLRPLPPRATVDRPPPRVADAAAVPVSEFVHGPFFSAARERCGGGVPVAEREVEAGACPESQLDLRLVATFYTHDRAARAVFRRPGAPGRTLAAHVDDALRPGVVVRAIERGTVRISNQGRCERLTLEARSRPPSTARPAPDIRVRRLDSGELEVARADVERLLSDLPAVSRMARIVPSFQDGRSVGFKLFSIRPKSPLSQLGLQNGDVVRRVNGLEIASPERALRVYTRLREARRITLDLKRRGRARTQVYTIR